MNWLCAKYADGLEPKVSLKALEKCALSENPNSWARSVSESNCSMAATAFGEPYPDFHPAVRDSQFRTEQMQEATGGEPERCGQLVCRTSESGCSKDRPERLHDALVIAGQLLGVRFADESADRQRQTPERTRRSQPLVQQVGTKSSNLGYMRPGERGPSPAPESLSQVDAEIGDGSNAQYRALAGRRCEYLVSDVRADDNGVGCDHVLVLGTEPSSPSNARLRCRAKWRWLHVLSQPPTSRL